MFALHFQISVLVTFHIVVCRVFWAGGLSLQLNKILKSLNLDLFSDFWNILNLSTRKSECKF